MLTIDNPLNDETLWLKMIIFGEIGVGKTVFLGSSAACQDSSETLFVDCEAGTKSLRKFYPNTTVVKIKSYEDLCDVYDFLRSHTELRDLYYAAQKKKDVEELKSCKLKLKTLEKKFFDNPNDEPKLFRAVCFDTLDEIQRYVMSSVLKQDDSSIAMEVFKNKTHQDWGKSGDALRTAIRYFRNLDIHFFVSAHTKDVTDATTGEVKVIPSLSGQLANDIGGYFDIVGFLYQYDKVIEHENGEKEKVFSNRLLTQKTKKYLAKDRFDLFGKYIDEPTIEKIISKIKQSNKGG